MSKKRKEMEVHIYYFKKKKRELLLDRNLEGVEFIDKFSGFK